MDNINNHKVKFSHKSLYMIAIFFLSMCKAIGLGSNSKLYIFFTIISFLMIFYKCVYDR